MARISSLVWAVPMTLALLVLAKGAFEPGDSQPQSNRIAAELPRRLSPPGRLHAPDHARPVAKTTSQPVAIDAPPTATGRTPPQSSPTAEKRPQPELTVNAAPNKEQATRILYPIAENNSLPQMADAFPNIERIAISPQGPVAENKPRPSANAASPRAAHSPAMDQALSAVRQQVATMNQNAVKLAQRGALYSARAELLEALRLIAQTQDAQSGTSQRTSALAAAITAMDESDDFTPPTASGTPIALADIIRPHQTPVLKRIDAGRLSPLTCSQHYYAYAQQQLSQATGGLSMAASTLSLLGMVHGHMAGQSASGKSSHTARAIVFHQATLAIDKRHYRSANELGVLWARCGELSAARRMLLASVESQPTASAWHNLAAVHERLGENDLAQLARKEAGLISPKTPREAGPSVEWVDAATFAGKGPRGDGQAIEGKTIQASAQASAGNQAVRR